MQRRQPTSRPGLLLSPTERQRTQLPFRHYPLSPGPLGDTTTDAAPRPSLFLCSPVLYIPTGFARTVVAPVQCVCPGVSAVRSCRRRSSPSPPTAPPPVQRRRINIRLGPVCALPAPYPSRVYTLSLSVRIFAADAHVLLLTEIGQPTETKERDRGPIAPTSTTTTTNEAPPECFAHKQLLPLSNSVFKTKACGILIGRCTAICDPMCSGSIPALENTLHPPIGRYLLSYANSASPGDLVSTLRREKNKARWSRSAPMGFGETHLIMASTVVPLSDGRARSRRPKTDMAWSTQTAFNKPQSER